MPKSYHKIGLEEWLYQPKDDPIAIPIKVESGATNALKNPVEVKLELPSGSFSARFSPPLTQGDIDLIIEVLRMATADPVA